MSFMAALRAQKNETVGGRRDGSKAQAVAKPICIIANSSQEGRFTLWLVVLDTGDYDTGRRICEIFSKEAAVFSTVSPERIVLWNPLFKGSMAACAKIMSRQHLQRPLQGLTDENLETKTAHLRRGLARLTTAKLKHRAAHISWASTFNQLQGQIHGWSGNRSFIVTLNSCFIAFIDRTEKVCFCMCETGTIEGKIKSERIRFFLVALPLVQLKLSEARTSAGKLKEYMQKFPLDSLQSFSETCAFLHIENPLISSEVFNLFWTCIALPLLGLPSFGSRSDKLRQIHPDLRREIEQTLFSKDLMIGSSVITLAPSHSCLPGSWSNATGNIRRIQIAFYDGHEEQASSVTYNLTRLEPSHVLQKMIKTEKAAFEESVQYFRTFHDTVQWLAKNDDRTYPKSEEASQKYSKSEIHPSLFNLREIGAHHRASKILCLSPSEGANNEIQMFSSQRASGMEQMGSTSQKDAPAFNFHIPSFQITEKEPRTP
ncbi:uncharacterized protein CLUP02_14286 [Colletotrichum lupini]|uniref:Uncharacterized protein n=1 Tax=Colletotrichum lupini TaxID=145971 RepID=A0A9Q8WMK8_9PEZI|nr:uncharacterized protein CLUP02_14286 [Colletotrichum lupini]UQC88761.1 hypothetical protein CLUP02_14286 [Colletotrichum lupini]